MFVVIVFTWCIQVVGVRFSTGRGRRKEPEKKLGPIPIL